MNEFPTDVEECYAAYVNVETEYVLFLDYFSPRGNWAGGQVSVKHPAPPLKI